MRLHLLIIKNFRGIRQLTWHPLNNLTCLIGPGDSTKTTILEALGLILSTRSLIKLCDADFYEGKVENPILIEAVLTELPEELISLDGLGAYICGVAADGSVHTDPEEDDTKALTVRFTADESLEPIWDVIKPDAPEITPRHLTISMREKFGVFRVDEDVNMHLRWGRGSALAAITAGVNGATSTTVEAQRAARKAVFETDEKTLSDATMKVKAASNTFGAAKFKDLRVGLDPQSLNTGYGLVLHDGEVPLTNSGLGTRRLTSFGIQEARTVGANIIFIDEVETGLEPHRLLHLLQLLKTRSEHGAQIVMTTHSPLVVEFFGVRGLAIVHRDDAGNVVIREVPEQLATIDGDDIQRTIRSGPSAMLAKKIVVVEGATEMGVFRCLFEQWDEERISQGKEPLAIIGTVIRNGQGDKETLEKSSCLAQLGFPVAALLDSNNLLIDIESKAVADGARVIRWGNSTYLEGRILEDLPDDKLQGFVDLAIELNPTNSVINAISAKLSGTPTLLGTNPVQWSNTISISLSDIRQVIGEVAHRNKWFKDEQRGMQLGKLIHDVWNDIQTTSLVQRITELKNFAYDEELEEESDE